MRNYKLEFLKRNIPKTIIFYIILLVFHNVLKKMIMDNFDGISSTAEIEKYVYSLWVIFVIICVFSAIWWYSLLCNENVMRNLFEKYSFIIMGISVFVFLGMALIMATKYLGITDKNNYLHKLKYVFLYPGVYIVDVLLCAPENIREVILPGRLGRHRFAVSIVFAIMVFLLYVKCNR